MSDLDEQVKHIEWFSRLIIVAVLLSVGLATYWTLEPDPLHIDYIDDEQQWSKCDNRAYSFKRLVASDKDIAITVQERWHDLNGLMDYKGTEVEYVYGTTVNYTLGAGFSKVMTFNKTVPKDIPIGVYEYRPWATYKVNPIKTITKLLPIQNVNVICDAPTEKQ